MWPLLLRNPLSLAKNIKNQTQKGFREPRIPKCQWIQQLIFRPFIGTRPVLTEKQGERPDEHERENSPEKHLEA